MTWLNKRKKSIHQCIGICSTAKPNGRESQWRAELLEMLMATGNLSAVQANLGHRSQRVTERYAKAVAALRTGDADKTAAVMRTTFGKSQTNSQMLPASILNSSEVSVI